VNALIASSLNPVLFAKEVLSSFALAMKLISNGKCSLLKLTLLTIVCFLSSLSRISLFMKSFMTVLLSFMNVLLFMNLFMKSFSSFFLSP